MKNKREVKEMGENRNMISEEGKKVGAVNRIKGIFRIIMSLFGLAIAVIILLAFFGVFDDEVAELTDGSMDDDRATIYTDAETGEILDVVNEKEKKSAENEEVPGKEKSASEPENSKEVADTSEMVNGKHLGNIGDVIKLVDDSITDGSYYTATIENINVKKVTRMDLDAAEIDIKENDYYIGYIDIDINNTSSVDVIFNSASGMLFMDDYQIDADSWPLTIDDYFGDGVETNVITVIPGRKGKFRYYAIMTTEEADAANTIEFVAFDTAFLFKEDGKWLYGDQATAETSMGQLTQDVTSGNIVYGSYSYSPNAYGNTSRANIGFYTDEGGGDYMSIYVDAGESTWTVNCYDIVKDGDGYIATDEAGCQYRLTFTSDGMTIQEITGSVDPNDSSKVNIFNGLYHLDEALNINEVS